MSDWHALDFAALGGALGLVAFVALWWWIER